MDERTDYMNIYGFIGKPDAARKTRGDQYFFVNNRFIRSAYLNHAVSSAFEDLLPKDSYPLYVLFIDLDPAQIDINVHPTKQEIKFEDEKIVYAFVQSAVRHALAQFSISPSLDFTLDAGIQHLEAVSKPFGDMEKETRIGFRVVQDIYPKAPVAPHRANRQKRTAALERIFYHRTRCRNFRERPVCGLSVCNTQLRAISSRWRAHYKCWRNCTMTYLIMADGLNGGFLLIHQQLAHERILYEQFVNCHAWQTGSYAKESFSRLLQLATPDAILLEDLLPELQLIGYEIEPFGQDSFIIQGTPADIDAGK